MNLPIDLSHRGFSLANAQTLAGIAALAYSSEPTIKSDRAHVLIVDTPQAVIVAFRGTASLRDALTDARVRRIPAGRGLAHEGFVKSLDSFTEMGITVYDTIRNLPHFSKPILLTGHSLGGGQAVECARRLRVEGYPVHSVYTFGQPRVGNRAYARQCHRLFSLYRLVHAEDIVPRLPWLGFWHHGRLEFLPSYGKGILKRPSVLKILLSDFIGWIRGVNHFTVSALADHHVSGYVDRLAAIKNRE